MKGDKDERLDKEGKLEGEDSGLTYTVWRTMMHAHLLTIYQFIRYLAYHRSNRTETSFLTASVMGT